MFLRIDNSPPTVFKSAEAAEAAAREFLSDDDEWTFRVVVDPKGSGRAHVVIVDEDGFDVAKL